MGTTPILAEYLFPLWDRKGKLVWNKIESTLSMRVKRRHLSYQIGMQFLPSGLHRKASLSPNSIAQSKVPLMI